MLYSSPTHDNSNVTRANMFTDPEHFFLKYILKKIRNRLNIVRDTSTFL